MMKALASLAATVAFVALALPASAQQKANKRDLRMRDTVRVGDEAPDFTLKTQDGAREVRLSSFRGKRPVVLVFGSYT
ncbi:MAG: redoxin domain-containing protein [Verrucomicrobiota bacterium]|nr:redoxin domain-containing protein [Verrucomicrobiota bacterium]